MARHHLRPRETVARTTGGSAAGNTGGAGVSMRSTRQLPPETGDGRPEKERHVKGASEPPPRLERRSTATVPLTGFFTFHIQVILCSFWCLGFGAFLELGTWSLELFGIFANPPFHSKDRGSHSPALLSPADA
jgi:hypothetical protein